MAVVNVVGALLVASVGVSEWTWFGVAVVSGDGDEPTGTDVVTAGCRDGD